MSAAGVLAVSRGLELASGINTAFEQQAYAEFQVSLMENQMEEIQTRSDIAQNEIHKQGQKVVANQEAAYAVSGVKMEGSPMSVISDTLNDAAQAQYIKQRETGYELMGLGIEKAGYEMAARNETLILKIASQGMNTAAGMMKDKMQLQRYNTKNRAAGGAAGIGVEDRAGGRTQDSKDYLSSK